MEFIRVDPHDWSVLPMKLCNLVPISTPKYHIIIELVPEMNTVGDIPRPWDRKTHHQLAAASLGPGKFASGLR